MCGVVCKRVLVVVAILMVWSGAARADVMVLVHGYLGSAASWEYSGVNAELQAAGWGRAGILTMSPVGVTLIPGPGQGAANKAYAVELASIAPINVQADMLGSMLSWLGQQHPEENMILVGHSAGGVVARTAMVRGMAPKATKLVTIASPNGGTMRAVQALDYTDDGFGPICWMKRFFDGDTYEVLEDSWGVLVDLVPARPGNFLYWLNLQKHPDVAYYSILRSGPVGMGDELVPIYSQDLNTVPALQGKAKTLVVASGHTLHPGDGMAVLSLLNSGA